MTRRREVVLTIVAEDTNLSDLVQSWVRRIADESAVVARFATRARTGGCKPTRLRQILDHVGQPASIVIVATDVMGYDHRSRSKTYKQKRQALQRELEGVRCLDEICFAIAEPCAEAWLLADSKALIDGIERGTGLRFAAPATLPRARTEVEAKELLGRVVTDGTGGLPRHGFEYADEIVRFADSSRDASLADWVRDLRRRIGAATQHH